jgi:hypothetical protein
VVSKRTIAVVIMGGLPSLACDAGWHYSARGAVLASPEGPSSTQASSRIEVQSTASGFNSELTVELRILNRTESRLEFDPRGFTVADAEGKRLAPRIAECSCKPPMNEARAVLDPGQDCLIVHRMQVNAFPWFRWNTRFDELNLALLGVGSEDRPLPIRLKLHVVKM